ncbi:unnamed protein product, partial [Ectocarpus sp. 8 AP-2014]
SGTTSRVSVSTSAASRPPPQKSVLGVRADDAEEPTTSGTTSRVSVSTSAAAASTNKLNTHPDISDRGRRTEPLHTIRVSKKAAHPSQRVLRFAHIIPNRPRPLGDT